MATDFAHGKDTEVTVDGDPITPWTNNSEFTRGATGHNVTMYGADDEAWAGGLRNGKFTCSGLYDKTATTGTAILDPLVGTVVPVIRKPLGTGTGKPQQTFQALLVSYVETSPVADMVSWSAEFTVSGAVATTSQSA